MGHEKITLTKPRGGANSGYELEWNGVEFSNTNGVSVPADSLKGKGKKKLVAAVHSGHHEGVPFCTHEFFDARKRGPEAEDTSTACLGFKFATNVTSRQHGNRQFYWHVDMQLQGLPCGDVQLQAESHRFVYIPRPPPVEGPQRQLKLDDLVTDHRPGDLLVISGDQLGAMPSVFAEMRNSHNAADVCQLRRLKDS